MVVQKRSRGFCRGFEELGMMGVKVLFSLLVHLRNNIAIVNTKLKDEFRLLI